MIESATSRGSIADQIEFASPALLALAAAARDRAQNEPQEAIGAIVFSVVALEALMNEISEWTSSPNSFRRGKAKLTRCGSILQELESKREGLFIKIAVVHAICGSRAFDRGKRPWQDLHALTDIRNSLIHRKPIVGTLDAASPLGMRFKRQPNLNLLIERRLVTRKEAAGQMWTSVVQRHSVASWAVATCISSVREILKQLPPSRPRDGFAWIFSSFGV